MSADAARSEESLAKWLTNVGAVISLVAAVVAITLFYFGSQFDRGYFFYWKLHEGMFNRDFQDTLLRGLVSIFSVGPFLFLPLAFVTLGAATVLYVRHVVIDRVEQNDDRIREEKSNENKIDATTKFAATVISLIAYLCIVVPILSLTLSDKFINAGYASAGRVHKKINAEGNKDSLSSRFSLISGNGAEGVSVGEVITCVSQLCIFLDGDVVTVVSVHDQRLESEPLY